MAAIYCRIYCVSPPSSPSPCQPFCSFPVEAVSWSRESSRDNGSDFWYSVSGSSPRDSSETSRRDSAEFAIPSSGGSKVTGADDVERSAERETADELSLRRCGLRRCKLEYALVGLDTRPFIKFNARAHGRHISITHLNIICEFQFMHDIAEAERSADRIRRRGHYARPCNCQPATRHPSSLFTPRVFIALITLERFAF